MAQLQLTFDDIINVPVASASSVTDWNTFFDLPTYGTSFTGVTVSGNTVILDGGGNINIKANLFQTNTNLLSVYDEGVIVDISDNGFQGSSLTDVFFNNITDITGYYTFGNCLSLSGVSFPSLLYLSNDETFYGCTSLTTVGPSEMPLLYSGANYTFNASGLLSVHLPELTIAGVGFFDGTPLTNVLLPNLTTIGTSCFYNCASLTGITLTAATSMSDTVFTDCALLTTVDLPNLVTAGNDCFTQCFVLTNINLPNLVTAGSNFFNRCYAMTSFDLPNLTSIGLQGFLLCTSLTNLNIPSCTDLGGTVGDDYVFNAITGNTITLTIPPGLMTCNSGNPDGDIQYLQANNTVTILEPVTPTPTPTPTPTSGVVTTPTPSPTKTSTPTPSVTPSITPSPYPLSGISVNTQYKYDGSILGYVSGGTVYAGTYAPHPIYTDSNGIPYAQRNAITLGGFNGLNN